MIKKFVLFAFFFIQIQATYKFTSKNVGLILHSGATFQVNNPITDFGGSIYKDVSSTVTGSNITFTNGGALVPLGGISNYDPNSASSAIEGGGTIIAASGETITDLTVSGTGNSLSGQPVFTGDITLGGEESSVTVAVQSRISQNIVVNNGTVNLNDDLKFTGDKAFTGSGAINANNRMIEFGGDLNLTSSITIASSAGIKLGGTTELSSIMTLTGNNTIRGDGNVLDLGTSGQITVGSDSSLLIRDVIIKSVGGNNIQCYSGSTITLQNSTLVLDSDYSFTSGALKIKDSVKIKGIHTFAYQSVATSTIFKNSELILDKGLTFSYDPISSSSQLLEFTDVTSELILNGATIHTVTNLELTKGTLTIQRTSYLSSEATDYFDASQGIFFGNSVDDIVCQFEQGAKLCLLQGNLVNKNINVSSWDLPTSGNHLKIYSNASLILATSLDLGDGIVYFGNKSYFKRIGSSVLVGSTNMDGSITYSIASS
ncbi:MAG: hypothetical protein UR26_C0006G0006 [candidate division TM6 bacterium GW2011_GWF2_32_72]|nr:MAG: hypothetical protein UR26_C0006G0006 [candidate division TM6 bacterium GW2011_GWF2_32_72]